MKLYKAFFSCGVKAMGLLGVELNCESVTQQHDEPTTNQSMHAALCEREARDGYFEPNFRYILLSHNFHKQAQEH